MANVLLVGETWIIQETHIKGFDSFTTTHFGNGSGDWTAAVEAGGHSVTHLPAHEVPVRMPSTVADLSEWDVIVLSDIGSNSLAVPDSIWTGGEGRNAMVALRDWTRAGGGLAMCGGYLSFGGFDGKARYAGTPVEEALPVIVFAGDDRVENPEHNRPVGTGATHALSGSAAADWPPVGGYNRFRARPGADVHVTVGDDPFVVTQSFGAGRALAFATDIGPHWAPDAFVASDAYRAFWPRVVDWLAGDA